LVKDEDKKNIGDKLLMEQEKLRIGNMTEKIKKKRKN